MPQHFHHVVNSSVGGSDYVYIDYYFEAQDIANSGWKYNDANKFVTREYRNGWEI